MHMFSAVCVFKACSCRPQEAPLIVQAACASSRLAQVGKMIDPVAQQLPWQLPTQYSCCVVAHLNSVCGLLQWAHPPPAFATTGPQKQNNTKTFELVALTHSDEPHQLVAPDDTASQAATLCVSRLDLVLLLRLVS